MTRVLIPLTLTFFIVCTTQAPTLLEASPNSWGLTTASSSMITDGVSQVTRIDLYTGQNGVIYSAQVFHGNYHGWGAAPILNQTCVLKTEKIFFSGPQRITKIDVLRSDASTTSPNQYFLNKIVFYLNDGTQQSQQSSMTAINPQMFSFPISYGKEFVGFMIGDSMKNCHTDRFAIYQRPINCTAPSSIYINLSGFYGKSQQVASAAQTLPFLAIDTTSGSCGSLVFNIFYSPSASVFSLISLTDSTSQTIHFETTPNNVDAQIYNVTVSAKFSNQAVIVNSQKGIFYYTNSNCQSATITSFNYLDITTSVLLPASQTTQGSYDSISNGAGVFKCGPFNFTVTITKLTSPSVQVDITAQSVFQWDSGNQTTFLPNLVANPHNQPSHVGDYTVEVKTCLQNFPTSTCGLSTANVHITDCVVTSYKIVQRGSNSQLTPQLYDLTQPNPSFYNLTVSQSPNCSYSTSNWAVSAGPTISGNSSSQFLQINNATGEYTIMPGKARETIGEYTIVVSNVLINGVVSASAQLPASSQFILTVITGCNQTTLTASPIQSISLKVWDLAQSYPLDGTAAFSDFIDSASQVRGNPTWCPKNYEASISTNAAGISLSAFSFNTSSRQFFISSQSYDQIGNFNVTVIGKLQEFPNVKTEINFTISVIDPCLTTSLIPPSLPIQNMETSVLVQQNGQPYVETQQVDLINDQVSVNHGNQNGTQYCGLRQYSISSQSISASQSLNASELIIDSVTRTISIYTSNSLTVGIHSVTVSVHLANYVDIHMNFAAFNVTILPCIITAFTMLDLSLHYNQQYAVAFSELAWTINGSNVTTQVPACGYQQSLDTTINKDFLTIVSGSTIEFKAFTRDNSNEGVYNISIISTLQNYDFTPQRQVPTSGSNLFLNITNPCKTANISTVPTQIESFVGFAGFTVQSKQIYTFNDSVSEQRTLNTDFMDFCGEKLQKFMINDKTVEFISQINSDYIYFSPPQKTNEYGNKSVDMISYLKNYPTITSAPINFMVTILGSKVPIIKDKYYQVGQEVLTVFYEPFEVLPEGYDAGSNYIEAYLLKNQASLGDKIDFQCQCLLEISNAGWIAFSNTTNSFSIYTQDNSLAGVHSLVIVQSFEQFPEVHPYTIVRIIIKRLVFIPKSPPYFEPPLPSIVQENQCKNSTAQIWSYQLPSILDPSNNPVDLELEFDQSFFIFDNSTLTLRQKEIQDSTVQQTIDFKLKNLENITALFHMKVQFKCSVSEVPVILPQFTPKILKQGLPVKTPTWIGSISRRGVVEIKFYKNVFVPNFTDSRSFTQQNRRLDESNETLTLDKYISSDVITVKLQSQSDLSTVVWKCISFTEQSLKLQLNFSNPTEISQQNQDKLVVKFKQTDQFILQSKTEYLFQNESEKTLYFDVPKQLPVLKSVSLLQSVASATQSVGIGLIIGVISGQVVAKKVITTMWLYFCSLQLTILIVLHSRTSAPASVEMIVGQIAGIINLSSIDKDVIARLLHLDVITKSAVYKSLDGVALSAIGILIAILVIGIALLLSRFNKNVQAFILGIKRAIFWNFLIRYFQASFISFNFAAFNSISNSDKEIKEIVTSTSILVVQFGLVIYTAFVLCKGDLKELDTDATRKRIGNIYFNLKTNSRLEVLYGLIFFVQRSFVVLLIACCYSSIIQWQLCQVVLLINTAYLLTIRPYRDSENAAFDRVNCCFLLLIVVLQSTYSFWNTDTVSRFMYGMGFDAIVILQFVLNVWIMLRQVQQSLILKLKRRMKGKKQRCLKSQQLKIEQQNTFQTSKTSQQPESATKLRQQVIKSAIDSSEQRDQNYTKEIKNNHREDKLKFQMEKISEVDEFESFSSDQLQSSQKQPEPFVTNQKNLKTPAQKQLKELLNQISDDQLGQSHKMETKQLLDTNKNEVKHNLTFLDQLITTQSKKGESVPQRSQYIDAKIKKSVFSHPVIQRLQVKTEKVREVSQQSQTGITPMQQRILDMEVQEYFQIGNRGVRRYGRDKVFTWQNDIWPYYKQVMEPNYSGRTISQEEHVQQMVQHIKQLWIESYPEKPYLPLQVKIDFYRETCKEIEPQVKKIIAGRGRQV